MEKLKATFRPFLFGILYLLALFLTSIICHGVGLSDWIATISIQVSLVGTTSLFCLIGKEKYNISVKDHFSFRTLSLKKLLFYAGLALSFNIVLTYIYSILKVYFSNLATSESTTDLKTLIVSYVVGIFFAPIIEEIGCRLLMIESSKKEVSPSIAILVSSFVFSMLHLRGLLNSCHTFLIALVFGYIYIKTNNVLYTIVIHSMSNAVLILMDVLYANNVPIYEVKDENFFINKYLVIFCSVLFVFLFVLLIYKNKKKEVLQSEIGV